MRLITINSVSFLLYLTTLSANTINGQGQISLTDLINPALVSSFDSLSLSQYPSPLTVDTLTITGGITQAIPPDPITIDPTLVNVAHSSPFVSGAAIDHPGLISSDGFPLAYYTDVMFPSPISAFVVGVTYGSVTLAAWDNGTLLLSPTYAEANCAAATNTPTVTSCGIGENVGVPYISGFRIFWSGFDANGQSAFIDNVTTGTIAPPVSSSPEPGAIFLVSSGLTGLAAVRRSAVRRIKDGLPIPG